MTLPILYTFRRCPYAMRARMALHYAGIAHTQHEVDLKNKPAALLALSPKATVPVLQLSDKSVLEESIDIMRYALSQNDPDQWLLPDQTATTALLLANDKTFKSLLDRYKYHNRFPECTALQHQENGEAWLAPLDATLALAPFLLADHATLADIALFPFIRQWHGVDSMSLLKFPHLLQWLEHQQQSPLFKAIMATPP